LDLGLIIRLIYDRMRTSSLFLDWLAWDELKFLNSVALRKVD